MISLHFVACTYPPTIFPATEKTHPLQIARPRASDVAFQDFSITSTKTQRLDSRTVSRTGWL
jgi:hypothetical protein